MKRTIKALLRRLGIIAMKRASRVYLPEEESYRIAVELCGQTASVIIDGGAHKGGTVEAFRAVAPNASFHCFEPDPSLAAGLRAMFEGDAKVQVVQAALGKKPSTAVFNINASRPTNSLLPSAQGLQSDLQGLVQTVEQVTVDVTSIDAYCAQRDLPAIDIVKLDLQGYDYNALVGARETLVRTRVVLVEVLFTNIYEGCRLFPDVLGLMEERGFRLFTLSGIHYGTHDELLWADAIFVRDRGRPDVAVSAG